MPRICIHVHVCVHAFKLLMNRVRASDYDNYNIYDDYGTNDEQ